MSKQDPKKAKTLFGGGTMSDKKRRTIVIGHKNPDTDSICSAICYARLKQSLTGEEYVPCRAGSVSAETQFVLDYFKQEAPVLVETVRTQVRDIEIRPTKGVSRNISLKKVWNLMQELAVVTIPAVNRAGSLEGIITVNDITKSMMNVYDGDLLAKARTQYRNILETLEGTLVVGDENAYFDDGKVLIAAANPDLMENYIHKNDLVILGNRYESQLCAIEMEAACIVVCMGSPVSLTIRKLAQEKGCTVITTPYDTYAVAHLINQSMPMSYFMKTEKLITFAEDDFIDDIRDIMAKKRHRDFPILTREGKYLGMISRRNLLGAQGKQIILVDHNEKNQAVDGVENAQILEIIDHHKLGTVQTIAPVFFRNQPVGCTGTIIFQMYNENHIEIDPQTAGLLASAIISDTLLFRSPTCTPADREAAQALGRIAGIDLETYASDMFAAGSDLKSKSTPEIFYQDFKRFNAGETTFGVGQISSLNPAELAKLAEDLLPYMKQVRQEQKLNLLFFMLTNILTQSTNLLCVGEGAAELIRGCFSSDTDDDENGGDSAGADASPDMVELPGVVSRKKQLVPAIMLACEE